MGFEPSRWRREVVSGGDTFAIHETTDVSSNSELTKSGSRSRVTVLISGNGGLDLRRVNRRLSLQPSTSFDTTSKKR